MTPAITLLAANAELAEPVAAGWQLIPRDIGRHCAHRRADHVAKLRSPASS